MTAIQIYGLLCFTVVLHIHTTISVVKVKRNAAELSSDTHRIELSRVPASSVGRNEVRLFGVSEQFTKYTEWVNYVHFLDIKGQNTRTFHLHAWFRSRPMAKGSAAAWTPLGALSLDPRRVRSVLAIPYSSANSSVLLLPLYNLRCRAIYLFILCCL